MLCEKNTYHASTNQVHLFFVVHFSATFRCMLGVQENRGGLIWLVWSVIIDINFILDIDQVIPLLVCEC